MSSSTQTPTPSEPLFLYKLSPTIPRPHLVMMLGGLRTTPPTHPDPSDATFSFVEIDLATKHSVQKFLAFRHERGLFIPLPYPSTKHLTGRLALGHKMQIGPAQDQYPVPYFLSGELASSSELAEVCSMESEPFTVAATVLDGEIKFLNGKRPVLVDRERGAVEGKMYVVKNAEEEDKMREWMGSYFEVVKCTMEIFGGRYKMEGCAFRYCGPEGEVKMRMD